MISWVGHVWPPTGPCTIPGACTNFGLMNHTWFGSHKHSEFIVVRTSLGWDSYCSLRYITRMCRSVASWYTVLVLTDHSSLPTTRYASRCAKSPNAWMCNPRRSGLLMTLSIRQRYTIINLGNKGCHGQWCLTKRRCLLSTLHLPLILTWLVPVMIYSFHCRSCLILIWLPIRKNMTTTISTWILNCSRLQRKFIMYPQFVASHTWFQFTHWPSLFQDDPMAMWRDWANIYLAKLQCLEAPELIGSCTGSACEGVGQYQCLMCFNDCLFCQNCLIAAHLQLYLHRIQVSSLIPSWTLLNYF